jgi:hypothetical protein
MSEHKSIKRPSHCDELAELLPAFSAGALNGEEVKRVKALLQLCPDQRIDLTQYATIMAAFYERITPVAPPRHLHDSLMRKIRTRNEDQRDEMVDEPHTLPELLLSTQTDLRDD